MFMSTQVIRSAVNDGAVLGDRECNCSRSGLGAESSTIDFTQTLLNWDTESVLALNKKTESELEISVFI